MLNMLLSLVSTAVHSMERALLVTDGCTSPQPSADEATDEAAPITRHLFSTRAVQHAMLSEREASVVRRHFAKSGLQDGARVPQWRGARSVYYADSGKMWVHRDNARAQALQELVFYASWSVAGCLTCSHPLKFWDLGRHATPRETARVQGFPDRFRLPETRFHRLLANAVAIPCARFAVSRVLARGEAVTFVDLCSGVGGFHVAVAQASAKARCVGFSEICGAAAACYEANFPSTPALGDARRAAWPACDLLVAGCPCTAFSVCNNAERRAHHPLRDFYKVVLRALRETGATRVVLENVPTLLTNGGDEWAKLLRGLRRLGFALDGAVLDSVEFGLPQRRRRLYVVGRRDGVAPKPLADAPTTRATTLRDILESRV